MSKRAFDIVVAGVAFVLTSPIALLITFAQLVEGKGSSIRPTVRIGRHGRPFVLLRFRTMSCPNGETNSGQLTTVGQFIRNYSLDDLPQLYNILKGEMSIIGPRPFEVHEVDPTNPVWQELWIVKPGLVSYAILLLNRDYNSTELETKLALEAEYAGRQSLLFDLKIAGKALAALVQSRGNVKLRGRGR